MTNLSGLNLNNGSAVGAKREGMDCPSHGLVLMPKYDEYKRTPVDWLESIPSHWNFWRFKYLLKEINIRSATGSEELLSLSKYKGVIPKDSLAERAGAAESLVGYKKVFINDLVINKMQAVNGLLAVSKIEGITSPDYSVYRPIDPELLDYRYLGYLLSMPEYLGEFKRRVTGVMEGFIRLYTDDLFAIGSILPPHDEQTLIANFLDQKTAQIDEAIAIKEQQINLLKERKQIIIQQAVTQGLDPNVPMKDSGVDWIGKIPAHWSITPIKRICEAYGRIGFRGYNASDLVNEGEGAITLSPSNLTEYEMDFTKCSYLSWDKYYESPEIQIMESDILIVKTGSSFGKTGFVNYLPMKATINPQLLVLKSIKVNRKYLYLLISSGNWQEQIKKRVIGSTIPTISETRLLSMQATVPPEEEQDKIISYIDEKLNEIDEIINLQHEQVNLFREYKASLINSAVTGKIKITPEMVEQ